MKSAIHLHKQLGNGDSLEAFVKRMHESGASIYSAKGQFIDHAALMARSVFSDLLIDATTVEGSAQLKAFGHTPIRRSVVCSKAKVNLALEAKTFTDCKYCDAKKKVFKAVLPVGPVTHCINCRATDFDDGLAEELTGSDLLKDFRDSSISLKVGD